MRTIRMAVLVGLVMLVAVLAGCEGYSEMGARTSERQGTNGGDLSAKINSANGTAERSIEIEGGSGLVLEADVTLSVGKGSYKIELLGSDGAVTLTLEASEGQSVSGHGQMVADTFGEANYRVTAAEAEDIEYTIVYVFR